MKTSFFSLVLFLSLFLPLWAQEQSASYQDLQPILQNHCLGCHNAEKKKGDLDLSSYSGAMAGGSSGDVVATGDSGASSLYKVVAHLAEPKMPPKKPKISDAEIAVFKKWIDGGLIEAPGGKAKKSKGPKVDLALKTPSAGKPAGPAAMPEDLLLEPELRTKRAEAATAIASSPWAPLAAVAGQHQVLLFNTDTLDLAGILPFPERRARVLRFSRNGSLVVAGGGQGAKLGRVVAWDVKSGDRVFEIGEEFDTVLAADLSPNQSLVALGGPSKLIKIYSVRDGELQHSIKKHTDWVTALEFSPDGKHLATGDRSGGLHVWEAQNGGILYSLNGHKAAITDVSWRPDSNLLASASEDGQVILWEMGAGAKVKGWQAHPAAASVKYAPDGRLVSCGRDMMVRVWDGNGTKLKEFEPFTDLALHATFSHDGARVLAGDWTGEIRVWNAADGKRLGQLSTNPPTLADRLEEDAKALDAARIETVKAVNAHEDAKSKQAQAETIGKSAQAAEAQAKAGHAAAEAGAAEAEKALATATQGVAAAQNDIAARQADAAQKAELSKQAQAALQKAKDENQDVEKLSQAADKARADAEAVAGALGPAQKTLVERQAAQKQAADAKTAAQAALPKAQAAQKAATLETLAAQKQVAAAASLEATTKANREAAQARQIAAERRLESWKAAQFNVQVHAAKRELAKVQAEQEALASKADDARKAASDADAKAKAGEKTVADAQAKIAALQAALLETLNGPARAETALQASRKTLADKEARRASAAALATQLGDAKAAADKLQEAVALLAKDVEEQKAVVAARAADIDKAKAAIPLAEKAVVDAKADADAAAKKAAELKAAAAAAAQKIAPEQVQADSVKPRIDAAKAKVESLRAEYLKLKPKAL